MAIVDETPTKVKVSVYEVSYFFGGGGILFTLTKNGKSTRKLRVLISRKMPYMPRPGDYCEVTGTQIIYRDDDGKYVDQINALMCVEIDPHLESSGSALKCYLQCHLRFRKIGVGRAKLNRLFEIYGPVEVVRIFDLGISAELVKVKGYTLSIAQNLILAWKSARDERVVASFLQNLHIDTQLATKIMQLWPGDTVGTLTQDPYLLLEVSDWRTVDRIAKQMQVVKYDDRRICACIRHVIYERLKDGHTLTPFSMLLDLAKMPEKHTSRGIQLALSAGYIRGDATHGYQSFSAHTIENLFKCDLIRLMKNQSPQNRISERTFVTRAEVEMQLLNYDESEIAAGFLTQGGLTSEQREAIIRATTRAFSVIVGAIGTGKKTIAKAIQSIEERLGGTVFHLTPNEPCAHQIQLATGGKVQTIEAFLLDIEDPDSSFQVRFDTLVVINDAAMMDLSTGYRLLRRLKNLSRLVLIGDDLQSPPLGYGLFFHALAEYPTHSVRLNHTFAEANDCCIQLVAHSVLNRHVPKLPRFTNQADDVSFIECPEQDIMASIEHFLDVRGLRLDSVQILVNERRLLQTINDQCQAIAKARRHIDGHLESKAKMAFGNRRQYLIDDPIIYMKDSVERALRRGTLGRIIAIGKKGGQSIVDCVFDGVRHTIPKEEMGRDVELGYAALMNENRGSNFPISLIVVTGSTPLLDSTALYTAFAKTMNQVVILGNLDHFTQMIRSSKQPVQREIGLKL